jgi:hypothetical protein
LSVNLSRDGHGAIVNKPSLPWWLRFGNL